MSIEMPTIEISKYHLQLFLDEILCNKFLDSSQISPACYKEIGNESLRRALSFYYDGLPFKLSLVEAATEENISADNMQILSESIFGIPGEKAI